MTTHHDNLGCRWFEEVWNRRNPDAIDQLTTPDVRAHGADGQTRGQAEFHEFHRLLMTAVPDLHVRIDRCVDGGDTVAVAWTATGSPVAGRPFEISGLSMMRVVNGKLVEGWDSFDFPALLEALGTRV